MRRTVVAIALFSVLGFFFAADSAHAAECDRPNLPAQYLVLKHPEMPLAAQQQGITGMVTLRVSLDSKSNVVAVRVQNSPSAILNSPAVEAVNASRFRTEIQNCVPIATEFIVTYDFDGSADGTSEVAPDAAASQKPKRAPAPSSSAADLAFSACKVTVAGNGGVVDTLEGKSRVARCVGGRGYRKEAISYLHQALVDTSGSYGLPPNLEDSNRDVYARLAMLEFAAGRIKDARKHIDTAVLLDTDQNDKEVDAAYRLIDPIARRKLFALRDKNLRDELSALSADQRAVRAKMGVDYREESFEAAGYHQVTWWYGGDHPYVAYTFTNGKLTSVYRP